MRSPIVVSAFALCAGLLSTTHVARAEDAPRTHLFARASLGAVSVQGSNEDDRDQAGVGLASQVNLGVRLLPAPRLHGTFFRDYAWDTDFAQRDYADPLSVTRLGLGVTTQLRLRGSWMFLASSATGRHRSSSAGRWEHLVAPVFAVS